MQNTDIINSSGTGDVFAKFAAELQAAGIDPDTVLAATNFQRAGLDVVVVLDEVHDIVSDGAPAHFAGVGTAPWAVGPPTA